MTQGKIQKGNIQHFQYRCLTQFQKADPGQQGPAEAAEEGPAAEESPAAEEGPAAPVSLIAMFRFAMR